MNKNLFAVTAPMGWNSYDYYDTTVTEEEVRANACYMAQNLKKYGWEYVIVDIQWYAHGAGSRRGEYQYIPFSDLEMDGYGRLLPCPERFPSSAGGKGFKPLADYIHSLGLKFGIHIMRGIPRLAAQKHLPVKGSRYSADEVADPSSICGWNPDMYGLREELSGSQDYYDSLLELYSEWGVDFIKCDDICNTNLYKENPFSAEHEIVMLHNAVKSCGRPVVLSLSPGPALLEKAWKYERYANMWRITDDFWDEWELLLPMFDRCELWQNHVSPGCFPDCDMLPLGVVGKGFGKERCTRFTRPEQLTMMTLWCMFGSPLMMGGELTRLDQWTLSLITNEEVLSLLKEGCHGAMAEREDTHVIWANFHEKTGSVYIALFNLSDQDAKITVKMEVIHTALTRWMALGNGNKGAETWKSGDTHREMEARELWTGECVWIKNGILSGDVDKHGVKLYRLL